MAINSRNKGAAGERELAKWLRFHLKLDYLPERNLEQVRNGGSDIIDIPPFYFECKRVEVLSLDNWWLQVVNEARPNNAEPVVAFRQNRKPWSFLISATHIGLEKGYMQLKDKIFVQWASRILTDQI